ncbi:hypothetical protein RRG08_041965, partial [Elysia crispata]
CEAKGELDICGFYTDKPVLTSKGECNLGEGRAGPSLFWMRNTVHHISERPRNRAGWMDIVEASLLANWRLSDTEQVRQALAHIIGCRGIMYDHGADHGQGSTGQSGWDEC